MAADSNEDVFNLFTQWKEKVAIPVAAIKALTSLIEKSQCSTMMGLEIELRAAADELNKKAQDAGYGSLCSLAAGCELFLRYVTRTYEELEVSMRDFSHIKAVLVETGKDFAELSMRSRYDSDTVMVTVLVLVLVSRDGYQRFLKMQVVVLG